MQKLEKARELGGNLSLFIIPCDRILRIISGSIYYTGMDPVIELECRNESISASSEQSATSQGPMFKHSIKAFLPGYTDQNAQILASLISRRFVVITKDSEGRHFRSGDVELGLSFEYQYEREDDPSSLPGYKITFSGELSEDISLVTWPPTQVNPD